MTLASDLGRELVRAYLPLEQGLRSGYELRALLRDMGWQLDLSSVSDTVVSSVPGAEALGSAVPDAVSALAVLEDGYDAAAALQLADAIVRIVDAVDSLATFDPAGAIPAGAGRLATASFWVDLAADLPEYLITRWLRSYHPVLRSALRLAGVIEDDRREGLPPLPDGVVPTFDRVVWPRLGELAGGGQSLPAEVYGWGGDFDHARLVEAVRELAGTLGIGAVLAPVPDRLAGPGAPFAPDHPDLASVRGLELTLAQTVDAEAAVAELGLLVVPVPQPSPSGPVGALLATPLAVGSVSPAFTLAEGVELRVTAAGDATGATGVRIAPGGLEPFGAGADAALDLALSTADDPLWRFPAEGSPALAVAETSVEASLSAKPAPELRLAASLTGASLVVASGDGLLTSVLGGGEVAVALDLEVGWSSTDGLLLGGSPGLTVTIPLDRTIGPITLVDLELDLGASDGGGARISARVSALGLLGPFAVSVEGLGVALAVDPASGGRGTLGPVDLALAVLPPTGLALTIEAPLTSGGGRISIDPESGRYEGALAIDLAGVGVGMIVVVDTELPGDPGGWAFFGSIGATFPGGIPLGFGFFLTGVGGIVALNRALDEEALALGLRDGAVDSLLFPEDPVRDAAVLVSRLDEYFPIATGNTVVGPVVQISWGVPVLVTGQLGVVISLPQGLIAVLGSLEVLIPVPDAPLLELHLDTLGVVDLVAGTVLVTASVYDSRLLGTIELSGDAAMYLSVAVDPYFLLSVGGFNPGFQPPSTVPSVFGSLRRMRADVSIGDAVRASLTAYFAVTPNTLQAGGGFELVAEAKVALATYSARGWFDFDVVVQADPFLLVADVSAGVGVYSGDRELLGVQLDAHLEGPEPWFATATASFKFFGIRVSFDVTVGSHALPDSPASVDVLELVAAQLALDEAWTAAGVAGPRAAVVLRDGVPDDILRPDDRIVVRQTVAPLDHVLEIYGTFLPDQSKVSITGASLAAADGDRLAGVTTADVTDWFAPATYAELRPEARLAAPSYEEMTAGVSFGAEGVEVTDTAADRLSVFDGHETALWEPSSGNVVRQSVPILGARTPAEALAASAARRAATAVAGHALRDVAVGAGAAARDVAGHGPVSVAGTTYVVVDGTTAAPVGKPAPDFASAVRAARGTQRVAPVGAERA